MCQMTDARYIQLKPKKPTEFEEYTGIVQKKAYVTPPPSHGSFLGTNLKQYNTGIFGKTLTESGTYRPRVPD